MKTILLACLLIVLSVTTFGQTDLITVLEGIRVKDSHLQEALFYYENNWAKLREQAIEKGFIHSFEMIRSESPAETGFDLALVTRYLNQTQYDKSEENFRGLIDQRGELRLLNDLKPGDFRQSVVVSNFRGDYFGVPGITPKGFNEKRIKLENEGWELIGDLTLPAAGHPVPAVILLNKANGTREVYKGLAGHLARAGIASLRIDLRAHGESINKGKFGPPFDEKMRALLKGSDRDISAIHNWLANVPEIDGERIGVVGASYTGEQMIAAARNGKYAKAYVALSPGSFSDESIRSIDSTQIPWFFVKSVDEIALMKEVFTAIRQYSKTARILEVSGKEHGTEILVEQPDIEELITLWFKRNL